MAERNDPSLAPFGTLRRARWALTALPLLMAVALIVTVAVTYHNIREVLATVALAQGEALARGVRRSLAERPPFSGDVLTTALAEQAEAGLRCIAVIEPGRGRLLTAGDCTGPESELRRALEASSETDLLVDLGDRVRMVMRTPGHPAGPGRLRWGGFPPLPPNSDAGEPAADAQPPPAGEMPAFGDSGPPHRDHHLGGRHDGLRMPAMLIELEPVATRELAASAARTLAIGGAASLALMAAALLFWRLSLRAQRLREEVERDRRLAALGRMSAVMAHEMLNPLASMKGHAQLLAESLPAAGRERGKAERVVAEAVRLEELSRGLLTFVRSQRIERREADPAAILRQAAEAVGAGRIDLDLGGAPERWPLDPDRLQQALVNLLHNALQASGDGGRAQAAVTVEEGDLVYSVRDHGPGVSPTDAERIFEPFFTTRVRGTGLGLAVTRQIVELHGGTIVARSNPGGGAELRISIPRR